MRVIVCGGRDYDDAGAVLRVLGWYAYLRPTIVHGGATGADTLAGEAAGKLGLRFEVHPADWYAHDERCYHRPRPDGKCPAAGPIRNQRMLDAGADLVVAFPGGRGTAHMVGIAKRAGVPVLEVGP